MQHSSPKKFQFVLIRHGESQWNQENRFTGWHDVDLSEKGRAEALQAAESLKKLGLTFDIAYTSLLKRAIRTLWIIQDQMDLLWLPVIKSWRLNERHYGSLTGLNKSETAEKYGEAQVKIWRRSYDTPPPAMSTEDLRHPSHDARYKNIPANEIMAGESLKDTVRRFLPLWKEELAPRILRGERLLIAAHGNSLRALIQHLENMTPEEIMEVNVPTGIPLMYEVDENLKVLKKEYLGDPNIVRAAMENVAKQGSKKQ